MALSAAFVGEATLFLGKAVGEGLVSKLSVLSSVAALAMGLFWMLLSVAHFLCHNKGGDLFYPLVPQVPINGNDGTSGSALLGTHRPFAYSTESAFLLASPPSYLLIFFFFVVCSCIDFNLFPRVRRFLISSTSHVHTV